jgi:hypothetical protein
MLAHLGAETEPSSSGSSVHTVSEHPGQVEHRAAHERILEALTTPGRIESGNELPVDLSNG